MGCNVLDNAVRDMYYKGIMSESRAIVPTKLDAFNKANLELKEQAKNLYGVNSEELPFSIVKEDPVKEITGSTYRRDNTTSILRAEPNKEFFNQLQTNFDILENEGAKETLNEEVEEVIDDYTGIEDFERLLKSGEITQFCSR